ncbi:MAG: FlgD immunoglobulin-like domain containing protein, partial [Bacteroidota bacterium]
SGTAPYMVELTPREQWSGFSPFYAPATPAGMEHYINVVADTASAKRISLEDGSIFPFTWTIPGTDLIWGTMPVTPGVTHTLTGSSGATFSGYVYGLRRGSEKIEFPGGPARYEEINALSYGYPLAPGRNVLHGPDSLKIDTHVDSWLHISIRALNPNPAGLRSIAFDPASVVNAMMLPIDPNKLSDIVGKTRALVDIRPVDMLKDASATVIIKDRTGAAHYVYYHYYAFVLTPDRDLIDFGDVLFGATPTDTITFTNLRDSVVDARDVRLVTKNFTLISTDPPIASRPMLKPGESIKVAVRFNGNNPDGPYADSLIFVFRDTKRAVFMRARIVNGPPAGIDLHSASVPGYALDAARPNPAGGKTTICYRLGASGPVNMSIYNAAGELVAVLADGARSAGEGSVVWDASALPAGTYYCRARAGSWNAALPIVVIQ